MNDKNSKEEDVFLNPFQQLRQELDKKATAAPAAKKTPAAPPAPPALAAKKRPANDDNDAALFLQAMRNPGFKPMKDAAPRERPADLERPGTGSDRPEEPTAPDKAPKTGPAPAAATPALKDELDIFASAMQGVKPVDGKGRDLAPPRPEPKINLLEDQDYLQDFLQGKVEFALEYTDEFFEGRVMGLDPLVLAKLRAGQYSPESHIDLHGQNAEQARESLTTFIRHAYNKGQRSLVVVTGRGKNSPGGLGVLRRNMQDWLTREPLKRAVLAFCTAQPKDGGTGAIYVLLRKYKKSGKIRWDRSNWPKAEA
ncbi:MAG: Smr/MutS family protein [Deltaproteobacteria bacterium]|jgi:DNA-nicking Smr family endonuclease|nr:Smr/MutS family protein [Deltaproteobacteria bacterium]